jgi:hypothetical protein
LVTRLLNESSETTTTISDSDATKKKMGQRKPFGDKGGSDIRNQDVITIEANLITLTQQWLKLLS